MCMFEVLKSVGKCDKITDVKYLMKMALQLNSYKSKFLLVRTVKMGRYKVRVLLLSKNLVVRKIILLKCVLLDSKARKS